MDPLLGLDFDAVSTHAFSDPGTPSAHTHALARLEESPGRSDLPAIVEAFDQLRQSGAALVLLRQPGRTLRLAMENGHERCVQHLLSQGVQPLAHHVKLATKMRFRPLILLLLQYGWPVNQSLGGSDPPALA